MNAYMRITIRVVNQGATQQIQQIRSQLAGIQQQAGAAGNAVSSIFGAQSAADMEKFGKNLQWTGRQLEYRFTLPLGLAAAAAGKWALDNEAALTRVRKVYGDLDKPISEVNAEVDALAKTFRVLSDMFGVSQKDAISIGAAWAQAGSHGAALAKQTRLTIEAMLLGEMEQEEAVKSLIAVQSQYELSAESLKDALATLNIIENQTSVGFGDLIQALVRAGGTARTAGVDIRHLAAMTAALVPATGSAENAGNALKTIISRMMSPTKDMMDLFEEMGLEIHGAAWASKDAVGRFMELSKVYETLTPAQQSVAGAVLASRFQVSKFSVLMRELASDTGNYKKALDASADAERNRAVYTKELGILLASQPQTLKILWTQLKNLATQAIVPLIPYLIMFMRQIVQWVRAFTNLSPAIQKTALAGLGFLVVLGPILAYLGAFIILGAQVWKAVLLMSKAFDLAGLAFEKTFGLKFIKAAGLAGRGIGQLVGLTARGLGQLVRLSVLGGQAILRSDAALWLGRLTLDALGWVKFQAIAVLYWGRRIALEVAGWLALRLALVAHWAAQHVFDAAQWALSIALARRGILARIVVAVAEWAALRSITLAGWAARLGIEAAGWSAAATTATIGSTTVAAASIGWIPLLIAAVALAMILFRDQVATGVKAAADWFSKLPGAVARILTGLMNVIRRFAGAFTTQLRNALNPFQRHSPSLVDLVIAGVDIIAKKYASLGNVGAVFRRAVADIRAFKNATQGARDAFEAEDIGKKREAILEFSPNAGPAIDTLLSTIRVLEGTLEAIGAEYVRQHAVVEQWAAALREANAELDRQQKILTNLREVADGLADELSAAKGRLSDLGDTPITGMRAFGDQIFANEMAQKRLRLEILRMGEAAGAVDDLKDRISSLQGDIELARAEQTSLRQAGADSSILAPLDAQIRAMESQQKVLDSQIGATNDLQEQLENLQRQGEILNLEQSLQFDPLKRQIDDVINSMEEMPFDELLSKIKAEKAEVARLTAAWDQASAALRDQEAAVKSATEARDRIQETYEAEKQSLDELGDAYDGVERLISEMRSELDSLASAASAAKEKVDDVTAAIEAFRDAGLGEFDVPGGDFQVDGEGGLIDIEALTKEWQAEIDKAFAGIDILKPLKELWAKAEKWVTDNFVWVGVAIVGAIAFGIALGPLWAALFLVLLLFKDEAAGWVKDNFMSVGLGIITAIVFGIVTWGGGGAMLLGLALGGVLGKLLDFAGNWARDHFGETGEEIVHTIGEGIAKGTLAPALLEVALDLFNKAWTWINEQFPGVGEQIIRSIVGGLFGVAGELAMAFFDILGDPIERAMTWGVNKAITALNWLIDQINRLPGVEISKISYVGGGGSFDDASMGGGGDFARGGQLPTTNLRRTGPFITNGARAIVGEGSPTHPEFVIPTDPQFRNRAGGLYQQLGEKLGLTPAFADGGILNKLTDFASSRFQDARGLLFGPIHSGMAKLIDAIPSEIIQPPMHYANDRLYDWLKGIPEPDRTPAGGGIGGATVGSGWQRITDYLDSVGQDYMVTSTLRPGAMTANGNLSNHALGKAVDMVGDMHAIFNVLLNIGSSLSELFFTPAGRSIKNGELVPWTIPDHDDHVHAATFARGGILRAANGALVRATGGGSLLRLGEGGRDEAVVPLPRGMRADVGSLGGGKREIHFHGDLSFPNITSPDDAEEFINNLETLAAS